MLMCLMNGNSKKSSVSMKETMEIILKVINYSDSKWNVSGDLKVIFLILELQLEYTKPVPR